MKFSIRLKLLLTMLLVTGTVVSGITVTIVSLFQKDKTAYIFDSAATAALHTAQEADLILLDYSQQVKALSHVWLAAHIGPAEKGEMLEALFADFGEVISLTRYDAQGMEQETLYNVASLGEAGIWQDRFLSNREANALPIDRIKNGEVALRNATFSPDLPLLSLTQGVTNGSGSAIISAHIHLRRLLALGGRSSVFASWMVDETGRLLAHPDVLRVVQRGLVSDLPVVDAFLKNNAVAGTMEYPQGQEIYLGAYARADFGNFGAIVQTPKSVAYLATRELLRALVGAAFAMLVFSAVVSFFWARRLTEPLQMLSDVTREVAAGNFNVRARVKSRDEVGQLAQSFNTMATELATRESALQSAQAALIQSEKMAAFGQLGAGIAHEIKNPLAGILGYAQLALRKAEPESPLARQLSVIEKETKRCKTIIENLLRFSRQEKSVFEPIDLNGVVEDAAAIVDHQLSLNRVDLKKILAADLPKMKGNANQLQQVVINLMINAQQAMTDGGIVEIETRQVGGEVSVRVSDNGPGIPPEIRQKIFEPFFTTKPVGQGTGLGLSVSYGIVNEHAGRVQLTSEVGAGTTFLLTFPVS
jgi:signal transduction histidine kinase